MKTNTKQILNLMLVISWIVYIGLSINAGTIIISFIVSLVNNPEAASNLRLGLDLSKVYDFGIEHYVAITSLLIVLACLKAHIFYLLIKVLSKLNITNPFSKTVASLIEKISQTALATGIVGIMGQWYGQWLARRGVDVMQNWGSSEFFFMAGVVFIIALVFKRGTEIQSENELTI